MRAVESAMANDKTHPDACSHCHKIMVANKNIRLVGCASADVNIENPRESRNRVTISQLCPGTTRPPRC